MGLIVWFCLRVSRAHTRDARCSAIVRGWEPPTSIIPPSAQSYMLHQHRQQESIPKLAIPGKHHECLAAFCLKSNVIIMLRAYLRPSRAGLENVKTRILNRGDRSFRSPSNATRPLRIVGPTLWCLAAASATFLGCACWDVYQEAKEVERRRLRSLTWNRQSEPASQLVPWASWQNLPGTEKLVAGAIGVNTAVLAMSRILPGLQWHFSHIPAGPYNYTLFTSMFGHAGVLHLAANMNGLYNFAPQVARSRVFQNSGAHLTAFYLSAGIFSSLAHHVTSKWASPRALHSTFMVPGLGASGAIFGILGAWAILFPNAQLGLLLIPGSLPADQALVGVALFETYGLLVGFRSINFGHAAHLAGLAIGSGYVYFDGKRRLWQPARRLAYRRMKSFGII